MPFEFASRYDLFLRDLETIVNLDSGSGHAPGLAAVAGFFQQRFERLGWHTRRIEFDAGAVPCLEVVNRRGLGTDARLDFLFLGHMDTVFPQGTAARRPFSVRDGRAWGPGVCDMKGGLVTMLHAAEAAEQAGIAGALSIGMAFNSDEEVGSQGSRPWFEALAARSRRVLVFEPCRATGHRVLQRKGVADYEIRCLGRAAHAGVEPEKGANAVLELARQVLAPGRDSMCGWPRRSKPGAFTRGFRPWPAAGTRTVYAWRCGGRSTACPWSPPSRPCVSGARSPPSGRHWAWR